MRQGFASRRRVLARAATALWLASISAPSVAVSTPTAPVDEFFIVSSVDPSRGAMVLKKPTEVTLSLRVDGKTRCVNEEGKAIGFTDLRAGDTVYIRVDRHATGDVAARIRKGPMTVRELQERYLRPRK